MFFSYGKVDRIELMEILAIISYYTLDAKFPESRALDVKGQESIYSIVVSRIESPIFFRTFRLN